MGVYYSADLAADSYTSIFKESCIRNTANSKSSPMKLAFSDQRESSAPWPSSKMLSDRAKLHNAGPARSMVARCTIALVSAYNKMDNPR